MLLQNLQMLSRVSHKHYASEHWQLKHCDYVPHKLDTLFNNNLP